MDIKQNPSDWKDADPLYRSLAEIPRSAKPIQKSVSFMDISEPNFTRFRAGESYGPRNYEFRRLEESTISTAPAMIEVVVRAYQFVSHSRVWSTWILVEVESQREHAVRAFELNGEFFLHKTPEALGVRPFRSTGPSEQWAALHSAIFDYVDVTAPRPRYSTSRLSSMRLIRENESVCGCLPSLSHQDSNGLSEFCKTRQIAQKAMLQLHHKLQSRSLDSILSLKWSFP
ncbi:hypothetical protein GCK72_015973 [Caenorhabditis remanei]|uniref:Uncharacterized protein n=1 Tax=Caenorhabditis remanei TaxID=31234 RepID=A0A6A5GY44_CAERE|nr:hypothetical protein GCK72_015973 [Caenorhabditis remanei]KAF1759506.1 hypothetical protein GCK72_015973 [Caenorhabditis remanei]